MPGCIEPYNRRQPHMGMVLIGKGERLRDKAAADTMTDIGWRHHKPTQARRGYSASVNHDAADKLLTVQGTQEQITTVSMARDKFSNFAGDFAFKGLAKAHCLRIKLRLRLYHPAH
jgi:hypothetical protein